MKAAQINNYGDASVVHINDTKTPAITDTQVLVKVATASLNPFDTTVRSGHMKDAIPLKMPATLGGDLAGTVVKMGANVSHVAVGDTVYGQAYCWAGSGTFAEYTAAPGEQVAKAPQNLSIEEIGALPLAGASAVEAIIDNLAIKSGQKLFIHGGAGAIGALALQIAKHIGAYVAVTASGDEDVSYVKSLGANQIIDYKTTDFGTILSGYDAAFDTVGGQDFTKCLYILKKGGAALTMIGQPNEDAAKKLGVTAERQGTKVATLALDTLRTLADEGVIRPRIGQVFSLAEIQLAFIAREAGSIKGKIILKIG